MGSGNMEGYSLIQSVKSSVSDSEKSIEIIHDTLERISSGLNEESLVFFSVFCKKFHRESNMSFGTGFPLNSILFWYLSGIEKVVAPKKRLRELQPCLSFF